MISKQPQMRAELAREFRSRKVPVKRNPYIHGGFMGGEALVDVKAVDGAFVRGQRMLVGPDEGLYYRLYSTRASPPMKPP